MSETVRQYKNFDTDGPSKQIWADFPSLGLLQELGEGIGIHEDFVAPVLGDSALAGTWILDDSDVGASASVLATEQRGVLRLADTTTDNNELWIQLATPILYPEDGGPGFAFECRFRTSNVGDDTGALVIGVMEPKAAGDDVVQADDSGALADIDFIGFQTVHVNGGTSGANAKLNAVVRTAGAAAQTVISDIQTLAADTWYKVGFAYDGTLLRWYVDNVANATTSALSDTGVPADNLLAPVVAVKLGSAATVNVDVDFIRAVQLYS